MATHAPNLECRMYESRYPEVDMAVMIQVKNIADMGAYVSLLEYNNIEGMILFSELSRCQIRSVSSLIKVGRTEPVMVLRVDKDKGYIDLSKRRVSEEDIQTCEERYNKSKLVHSIMRHVAETLSIDLEELYVNIGWPLYRKYGHAFEAFKIVVTDPDSVLDTLTREVKELGPDGQEVKRVVPAVSEEVKDALVKNIRRRMTTQALKIRADIEMKCLQFDGVLHIKDAMRKADAVGNDDCPVKIKLVVPALYVLTTQTLEKEKGLAILNKAIVVCSEAIEQHKGKLVVKEAPRSVSERDDKLAEHMAKLRQDNEEVSSDEGSEEEVDTCMGEVDLENNHPTIWKIVKSSINQIQNNGKREIERTDYCEQRLLKRYRKKEGTKAKANGQSKGADREVKRAPKRDSRRVIEIAAQWLFLVSLVSVFHSTAGEAFDVRSHLSTVSSYNVGSNVVTDAFVPSRLLDDCVPVHLNLVARHGTRSPTKKRIRELDSLAVHMEKLIKDVEEQNLSLKQMPVWMRGWKSPWEGKLRGGELISKGEEELYNLGLRVRERFPDLFNDEYHPDVYVIKASQVPRASASAVAFGMGLFNGKGTLGQGNNRAFAVTSESRASDVLLRFHDCCANYKDFRKKRAPAVDKLKEPILEEITRALVKRFGMDFTRQDTSSLWFLCKQEASLLDITDQACGLFTSDEIALLEWTDDLEAFILKGYGNSLNYRMGMPLLQDVLQAMEEAISASKGKLPSRSYEKARLRFAHAETIVPFSCLLGLFLEGSEFQQILKEQPLDLPPKPPQKRNWRVSSVAPFGGNNMLVLYNCPSNSSSPYFVQVLHNEKPISVPGCGGASFCPFEDFKENIVAPHLKHDYHTICNVKPEEAVQERLPSEEFPSSPALLN